MAYTPMTAKWPADRAVLFVHGVGDAKPGDYEGLVDSVKAALGAGAERFAFYELYYNFINNWFKDKSQIADKLRQAKTLFKVGVGDPELAEAVAEYAGDVLWPILSRSARTAVREAYLAQLKQMVRDGISARVPQANQRLTIIAHSLGCFYTYEVLHTAATKSSHRLRPYSNAVRFANVVLMASPVQLIRTLGQGMGPAIPKRSELATLEDAGLAIPAERVRGKTVPSIRNLVSIVGELDPVGGFFYRKRAPWAYMQVEGQTSIVDPQNLLPIDSKAKLIQSLVAATHERRPPDLGIENPHSWLGYVTRHEKELGLWLNA